MTAQPKRLGASVDYARPIFTAEGIRPLVRRLKVKLTRGRMSDPCWVVGRGGNYGTVPVVGGQQLVAHRYVWAWAHDREIPAGHVIHHLCFVKRCVNPGHLALVTFGENSRLNNFEQRSVESSIEAAA